MHKQENQGVGGCVGSDWLPTWRSGPGRAAGRPRRCWHRTCRLPPGTIQTESPEWKARARPCGGADGCGCDCGCDGSNARLCSRQSSESCREWRQTRPSWP
eukprot:scaffold226214_cov43-Prasinocladus_malaysianus.AAC.1